MRVSQVLQALSAVVATATAPMAIATAASAQEPAGLHSALQRLADEGKFSGAVVVRAEDGVRFARGYGFADPFARRPFTPDTQADSGSLAKPVIAAAMLWLARDGTIDLDAPVQRYLPEYPHRSATVRHLLSHSAGLDFKDSAEGLANKTNAVLLAGAGQPLFRPGTAFTYCNLCSIAQAMLVERVSGQPYLQFVKERVALAQGVTIRPPRLADWAGRAIGYRRTPDGGIEPFDSWEGELFYGPANLSISASQLAEWASRWWQPALSPIRSMATTPARIGGRASGLTLGNLYCSGNRRRCHYLGHHEGFHHIVYWDSERRVAVAMLSNNALAPGLQQRLQRAIVAFSEGDPRRGELELARRLPEIPVAPGKITLSSGERVELIGTPARRSVRRGGIGYPAYPIGSGILYVPGLDLYLAGAADGRSHWLTLYEDFQGTRESVGKERRSRVTAPPNARSRTRSRGDIRRW